MTKILTKDLTDTALDRAVAECEGRSACLELNKMGSFSFDAGLHPYMADLDKPGRYQVYSPSTDWAQGGPIIERDGINVTTVTDDAPNWEAFMPYGQSDEFQRGPTPLIAAMRCYVASKLGDTVEVPEELA